MRYLKSWRTVQLTLVRELAERPYSLTDQHGAVTLLRQVLRDDPREQFVAVYLDSQHRPIAVHRVSTGTVNASHVHPREVFGPALQLAATALIVAHNHPSGDPKPSSQDRDITERLREAGDLLGLEVIDHIILGDGWFYSFALEATNVTDVP